MGRAMLLAIKVQCDSMYVNVIDFLHCARYYTVINLTNNIIASILFSVSANNDLFY